MPVIGNWPTAGTPRLSDDVVIKSPAGEKPASPLRQKLDLDISADLGRNFLFQRRRAEQPAGR